MGQTIQMCQQSELDNERKQCGLGTSSFSCPLQIEARQLFVKEAQAPVRPVSSTAASPLQKKEQHLPFEIAENAGRGSIGDVQRGSLLLGHHSVNPISQEQTRVCSCARC